MKIILIRHGKPDVDMRSRMSASEFGDWVKAFNAAAIDGDMPPSSELLNLNVDKQAVFTSTYARSMSSAKMLGCEDYTSTSLFCEAPVPKINAPFIHLKPNSWCVILRIAWLLGYSYAAEPYKKSRQRAKQASITLISQALNNGTAVLVGHGFMNRLIIKCLKNAGWQKLHTSGHGYWGFSVFELNE